LYLFVEKPFSNYSNLTITYSIQNIKQAALQIVAFAKQEKVWLLHGKMGAGKTTLVQAFCTVLEVNSAASSPTFSIINQYESKQLGTIFHMDWYRIKSEEEAFDAGVEHSLFSGNYCWIEWPSIVPAILPSTVCNIHIEVMNDTTRQATLSIGIPILLDTF
jgi:tRNA threonylcarbamoyladenosine biosynthesis protein TsaE